jgi:hypothetical protein
MFTSIFVPGHGQIAGRDAVQLSADLFDDIAAQAEKNVQVRRASRGCRRSIRRPRQIQRRRHLRLASFHRSNDPQTLQRMGAK